MDPIASFQGLASGINFRDLVDQIIQAESRPIRLMQGRIGELSRKTSAWQDFETRVQTLFDRSEDLADGVLFDSYQTALSSTTSFSATASSSADGGNYSIDVLQIATKEKVGSAVHADRAAALGFTGEFLIGGKAVSLSATDSLDDLNSLINAANAGSNRSGVGSAIVSAPSGGYRIVLTAENTGADGISLLDGSAGVLGSVGFLDSTTSLRNQTSNGATSDAFISSGTAVGSLLGLTSPPASGSVTIGGLSVTIDLSTDSLSDIATAINTAATGAGSSVSAQVLEVTDSDGVTTKRLDVDSTTSFSDTNRILETLGVLEAGRASVAQTVQGAAFTDGDAVTVATGSTLLTNLWGGGADASVQVNDTFTLTGTRGDGTTFSKQVLVGPGATYQDLADSLNDASDAFGVGSRTATASIDASGQLIVTDDTGGNSQLTLSIVAHNEGGGTLDFGAFSTATEGRDREITDGVNAEILVDGAFYSRADNSVSDVVGGVTLSLSAVSSSSVSLDVTRDVDAIVTGIESFVKSYNTVAEFVDGQFTGAGAEDGEQNRPLSGDGVVRTMRSQMRDALQTAIASTVSDIENLGELGITLNREGTYDIDLATVRTAIETDNGSVKRYFSAYGAGSTAALSYIGSTKDTQSGTYAVVITAAATQADVTGVGFAGTYVDDATADTLTLTDVGTQSTYSVSLTNGMTMSAVVDALNAEFQTETTRLLTTSSVMKSDAIGTDATDATLLQDIYDSGGIDAGIADGDVLTISGARDDGTSFFREWSITDVTTQSVADLKAEISAAIGTEVIIGLSNGLITATAVNEGRKAFTVAVSSDNAGGGTFSLGTFDETEAGRNAAAVVASESGGQLNLKHDDYGTVAGFSVAYTAGGTDGSASLGLAAASYTGIDVAGTMGGQAATGSGTTLTADADTTAEGLIAQYTGATLGAIGSVTFSRGIASAMESITDALLDSGGGTIQGILDGIDTQERGFESRIDAFEDRLELRSESLIKRFTGLEEAMARAQQQLGWLQAQLGSLLGTPSS